MFYCAEMNFWVLINCFAQTRAFAALGETSALAEKSVVLCNRCAVVCTIDGVSGE